MEKISAIEKKGFLKTRSQKSPPFLKGDLGGFVGGWATSPLTPVVSGRVSAKQQSRRQPKIHVSS
jgi:hypothetical protein